MRFFEFKPPDQVATGTQPHTKKVVSITPRQKQTAVVSGFVLIGFLAGLIYAWLINPVVWTNVPYDWLGEGEKTAVIYAMSDLSAYDPDSNRLTAITYKWPGVDRDICSLAMTETDTARQIRLVGLAYRVNGRGC